MELLRSMLLQELHSPQGSIVGCSTDRQLRDFAKIRAVDVLPVPLDPANK